MKRVLLQAGALALALGLLGCPSAPPPVAVEEPVPEVVAEKPAEKPVEKPVEKPAPAPVAEKDVEAARAALSRARDWAAEFYAPADYKEAQALLAAALDVRSSDPDRSRQLLADAAKKADAAFLTSVDRYAADMSARITGARERLLAMEADRYDPLGYADAVGGIADTEALYRAGDYGKARPSAVTTLRGMLAFERTLQGRLATVQGLRDAAEASMAEAEKVEAARWAPEQKRRANERFTDGLMAIGAYDLFSAEIAFRDARERTEQLLRLVAERRSAVASANRDAADRLFESLMRQLEEAAGLTVVTEDGTVIGPEPWSAEEELEKIRLEEAPVPVSLRIPEDGTTVVLGDTSTIATLLEQAREHWRNGVAARDRDDPAAAVEQFEMAMRLLEIYTSLAVQDSYVVQLVPGTPDCLWRIAAKPEVYTNPRLWPLLWRENRVSIPDPDLIEPGLVIAVPPLAEDRSRQLAEAFWLTGEQYVQVGKTARGREYQAAAMIIWPELDPAAIADPQRPDVAALAAAATQVPPEQTAAYQESVRSAFLRFGGAFREHDLAGMLAFVGGSLYLTDRNTEVSRAAVSDAFWMLLDDPAAGGLAWASVFDLATVTVAPEPGAGVNAFALTVTALNDLPLGDDPAGIARAGQQQRFHYRRSGSDWIIAGIGLAGAPAGWKPAAGPAIAPYRGGSASLGKPDPARAVSAFSGWLAAWLAGYVDEGVRLSGGSVLLRATGEELSGDGLRSSFGAWFAQPLLEGAGVNDLVDLDTALVEVTGSTTCRLTVQTLRDVSDAVPYWKSYQDYFLAWLDGAWKVEAIF